MLLLLGGRSEGMTPSMCCMESASQTLTDGWRTPTRLRQPHVSNNTFGGTTALTGIMRLPSLGTDLLVCPNDAVVDAQNALTDSVLEKCGTREKFKELMTRLYNYERFSCPFKRGARCAWACVANS